MATQSQTGTRNETYDLISVLYHALQGAENCQTYLEDAQDSEIRSFLQQALQSQRRIADDGKRLLQQCLGKDTGGQSAFGWGEDARSGQRESEAAGQAGA